MFEKKEHYEKELCNREIAIEEVKNATYENSKRQYNYRSRINKKLIYKIWR